MSNTGTAPKPNLKLLKEIRNPKTGTNSPQVEITDNLKMVLITQKNLRAAVATDIKFSQPILEQKGNAVIFPHTIAVIQGQAGVHKSRVAESICSAMLKMHGCKNETLGFKRTNYEANYTVVYVDTERNLTEQLPYALQSIQTKAGYCKEDTPPNFEYISLLQIKRAQRFSVLNEYLTMLGKTNTNPLFIVLDVSTDCIEDFNKTDKSMELIDYINEAVNNHNAVFLCLIHENPGSEKARGHFGTELMNKASTVLQVGFEKDDKQNNTELIRAKYLKCRSTARHIPFYFKYSAVEKTLVLASEMDITEAQNNRSVKADISDVIEHLEMYLGDGGQMERRELLDKLNTDFSTKDRTTEERIKKIMDDRAELRNDKGDPCKLMKTQTGKVIFYSLEKTEPF